MTRVMIVEDDPMVAQLNQRYLAQFGRCELVATCSSVAEATEKLHTVGVDLLLLDIFMPGKTGLDLLASIREQELAVDVIVISAASDMERIQRALRLGAVDYLIKPFEYDRFQDALTTYMEKRSFIQNQRVVSQKELDERLLRKEDNLTPIDLPKGLTKDTLKVVWTAIQTVESSPFSIDDLVEKVGISRVSVRKYLKFLIDINVLDVHVSYGTIGRPVYQHHINAGKIALMEHYK